MTTIKELAKEYCEGSSFEDAVVENPAFISGANAVLKEIEAIMATEFISGRVATDRLKLLEIHSRIKEFKGE